MPVSVVLNGSGLDRAKITLIFILTEVEKKIEQFNYFIV